MSSHHIIREKQEPALLVLDSSGFDVEALGQLLEWSPTVIATERSWDLLSSLGIKIDAFAGESPGPEPVQPPLRRIPAGQDALRDALNYLLTEGYSSVNVITSAFSPDQYRDYLNDINLVVYAGKRKIFAVKPGFSKWKPAGEDVRCEVDAVSLNTTGLEETSRGQFKTIADGFYSIAFDGEFLFISEDF